MKSEDSQMNFNYRLSVMKKLAMIMLLMPLMALADTEIVDGIPWTYTVSGGKAEICDEPETVKVA